MSQKYSGNFCNSPPPPDTDLFRLTLTIKNDTNVGVPVGWLVQRYNYRTIAVTGSAISSLGFILSGVVSSLELLYVTHGFLPG